MDIDEYVSDICGILNGLDFKVDGFVAINEITEILDTARKHGGRVYICGNGGSAATANHMAVDLLKGAHLDAISLCANIPAITAYANDTDFSTIFASQLAWVDLKANDVLIAISASGNSKNVIYALECARKTDCISIGLLGFDGGHAKELCDISIVVPSESYEQVEDIHLMIAHMIKLSLMV